jgi:hypothetical protein
LNPASFEALAFCIHALAALNNHCNCTNSGIESSSSLVRPNIYEAQLDSMLPGGPEVLRYNLLHDEISFWSILLPHEVMTRAKVSLLWGFNLILIYRSRTKTFVRKPREALKSPSKTSTSLTQMSTHFYTSSPKVSNIPDLA